MSVKSDRSAAPEEKAAAAQQARVENPTRINRQTALVLFALALALYLRTMARDVLPGDPGEFQFAAWNFGLAHATGYPLYLLLGGVWQRILGVVGVSPALALNLLSAVTGAATVALLFWAVLGRLPGTAAIRRVSALVAAAFLATNPTFWSQSLIAEVYALHALLLVLILLLLWRIHDAAPGSASPLWLMLVLGLSLAHHATTVFYLPGIVAALWLLRGKLTRSPATWAAGVLLLVLPLLLYAYVPLRATAAASPWYFPRLGSETLALYAGGWQGFRDFISGRSISVGFYDARTAWENLAQAGFLWRLHFGWIGLALILFGFYALARGRHLALLAFTLVTALLLQLFNLFYAIEDIFVYYIPLWVFGAVWAGAGVAQLGNGFREMAEAAQASGEANTRPNTLNVDALGLLLAVVMLYFPLRQMAGSWPNLDQSGAVQARQMWEGILAAEPAQGAVLVSNDRNEIVPLYYLQQVEGRRADLSGIFPLIAPEARFGDVGATVQTALDLAGESPVYLVKPMPGLESRFALEVAREPLVRVLGDAAQAAPQIALGQPYGPLTLDGLDVSQAGDSLGVRLYWRVNESLPGLYTTTVQAYDNAGAKIAQNDAVAGGVFYPTPLWKPGETLVEDHMLALAAGTDTVSILVGMYQGPEMTVLAPVMSIDLSDLNLGG